MSPPSLPTSASPVSAPVEPARAEAEAPAKRHAGGIAKIAMELTKARLNALVLVTTGVGVILAKPGAIDWRLLGWTTLGTGLAAASAAMLNQLLERDRDGLMHRTRHRPLPSGRVRRLPVFAIGVVSGYAGVAVLAETVNLVAAFLALVNILVYVVVYTPLKPLTTLNTLVGAVCGAIPPMIGWSAVTGGVETGAWLLGALLFVWQMPHFFALAWMYRDDYRRGGMAMLSVVDPQGELTARVMVVTSLLLVPLGLFVALSLAGQLAAGVNLALALLMSVLAVRFYSVRTDRNARAVFLASITYLPLALGAMVLDPQTMTPQRAVGTGRSMVVDVPMSPEPQR